MRITEFEPRGPSEAAAAEAAAAEGPSEVTGDVAGVAEPGEVKRVGAETEGAEAKTTGEPSSPTPTPAPALACQPPPTQSPPPQVPTPRSVARPRLSRAQLDKELTEQKRSLLRALASTLGVVQETHKEVVMMACTTLKVDPDKLLKESGATNTDTNQSNETEKKMVENGENVNRPEETQDLKASVKKPRSLEEVKEWLRDTEQKNSMSASSPITEEESKADKHDETPQYNDSSIAEKQKTAKSSENEFENYAALINVSGGKLVNPECVRGDDVGTTEDGKESETRRMLEGDSFHAELLDSLATEQMESISHGNKPRLRKARSKVRPPLEDEKRNLKLRRASVGDTSKFNRNKTHHLDHSPEKATRKHGKSELLHKYAAGENVREILMKTRRESPVKKLGPKWASERSPYAAKLLPPRAARRRGHSSSTSRLPRQEWQ